MRWTSARRIMTLPVALAGVAVLVFVLVVVLELGVGSPRRVPATGGAPETLLLDRFSSRSGWATFADGTASLGYSENGYRLRLFRPADDALSTLILPGKPSPSIAVTALVVGRGPTGGLMGVGCAEGEGRAYLGAVDPATGGFAILRVRGKTTALLRYGATEEGSVRGVGEENELQVQCHVLDEPAPRTIVRLFANGRLLAAYEDGGGSRPFRGMALGGFSLRRPLDALFTGAALQSLPEEPATPSATACDRLVAAGSLEADYRWLADSGGTRLGSPDFDGRQVLRIVRELTVLADGLEADATLLGPREPGSPALRSLADRLRAQRDALNTLTNATNHGQVDTTEATLALSCPTSPAATAPWRAGDGSARRPNEVKLAHRMSAVRTFDKRLALALPAPPFTHDETLPEEPGLGVDVSLRYHTYRVFGTTLQQLNRSLSVHGVLVRGDRAHGVTTARFESAFQPVLGPSGCGLAPRVRLNILITLPDWVPPAGRYRYLSNQWNQFMWDLEDHELHHAKLWIQAAGKMAEAINGTPRHPSCEKVKADARVRLDRVFRVYERRQREFDRDVAAGVLPGPSLP